MTSTEIRALNLNPHGADGDADVFLILVRELAANSADLAAAAIAESETRGKILEMSKQFTELAAVARGILGVNRANMPEAPEN